MATKKNNNNNVVEKEEIILGHYKDIHADFSWNSRSGAFWEDIEKTGETPEEGVKKPKIVKATDRSDWSMFVASILSTGTNLEAVICRPPAKAGGKPRLVTGFRRYRAVMELAMAANDGGPALAQKGLIRYVVREMSDTEARLINGIENIDRENISTADLCAFIGELVTKHNLNDVQIASRIGKSQPYVSRLNRIFKALSPSVLEAWRKSPVHITLDDIEKKVLMVGDKSNAAPSEDEQNDYFSRVQDARAGRKKDSDARGKLGWIDTKAKEALKVGSILGKLEGLNMIQIVEDHGTVLWECVELGKGYNKLEPKEKNRVMKKILSAFEEGMKIGNDEASEDRKEENDEE
jgi:ParB/RepB/Spo0J family partition protein